jgi:Transposase, Mutator family/Cro/C1-type HTH DNA-binding domain
VSGTRSRRGPVEIDVPRDRESSFEPVIVAKRQQRLSGIDDLVISLSAKGLTHGEISAHLAEIYGAQMSKPASTTITERVVEGMTAWQNRPLDPVYPVYPVIFIDCVNAGDPGGHRGEPPDLCRARGHRGRSPRHPRLVGWRGRGREGSSQIKLSTLIALCTALECTPNDLFDIDTTPVERSLPGSTVRREGSPISDQQQPRHHRILRLLQAWARRPIQRGGGRCPRCDQGRSMTVRSGACVHCGHGVARIERNLCARCHWAAQHAPLKQPCPRCGKHKALNSDTGRCATCSRACRRCDAPVLLKDRDLCGRCHRRAQHEARKTDCPRCGKRGILRASTPLVRTLLAPRPATQSGRSLPRLRTDHTPNRCPTVSPLLGPLPPPATGTRHQPRRGTGGPTTVAE